MKINYIIIPLIVFLVALIGNLITGGGLTGWYQTVNLPPWTPPGTVIGAVWTIIFILSAISVLIIWNKFPRGKKFNLIILTFIFNAFLNILWSHLFFGIHLIGLSVFEAALLCISVIMLIVLIRPVSRLAAILLYPYAIWSAFAAYLTYTVWVLN